MSYLLELQQEDRRYVVGIFESEETVHSFIELIPFVKKTVDKQETFTWINYTMRFEEMPEYFEISYNNYVYVLSKYSFVPGDNVIDFIWYPVHQWDKKKVENKTYIEGMTTVDAYSIPNNDVEKYIKSREQLFEAGKAHYTKKGLSVTREGIGTQDGEYVLIEDSILYLLDAYAVDVWEKTKDFEQFLKQYQE